MRIKPFRVQGFAFICSAILIISTSGKAFSQTSEDYWTDFRQKYPFHFQELLISDPDGNGQRSLIISEPPPGFLPTNAEQILKESFGTVYAGFEPRKHPIEFNGWVRDYVVTLVSPKGETKEVVDQKVNDGIAALSYALYGTTYKAHTLKLPLQQAQKVDEAPSNVSVSPGELKSWLMDSKRTFVSVDSSEAVNLQTLLDKDFTGVFLSQPQGLALLVLPRTEDIVQHWSDIRKFALDSDLILGGLVQKNDDALVIIGRERQTSLSAMPPLRAETILTLAATSSSELQQSIEGQHILAGKINKGEFLGQDWAPVYLSQNLIDTELGSLLNMTDELLKSWSEAGKLKTINFLYPNPKNFPFGGQSLFEKLKTTRLLYNWNTTGFGSVYEFGNYDVYVPTRTGSLPVTYGSDLEMPGILTFGKLTIFEEEAYDYFSAQRNTHLTQATNYTTLYQFFRAFPVKNFPWKSQVNQANISHINNEFKLQVLDTLQKIESGVIEIPEAEIRQYYSQLFLYKKNNTMEEDAYFQNFLSRKFLILRQDLSKAREEIYAIKKRFGANGLENLAIYLANPRSFINPPDNYIIFEGRYRQLFNKLLDSEKIIKEVNNASIYEPNGNIKTSTIVVSRYLGEKGNSIEGGHNLNSAVTKIIGDPSQAKDIVKINRINTSLNPRVELRIHPDNAVNSSLLARFYERNRLKFSQQQQFQIPPASKIPSRSINQALNIKLKDNVPGLSLQSEVPDIARNNVGFQTKPLALTEQNVRRMEEFAKEQNLDLYIEQLQNGFAIYRGHPPGYAYAQSPTALVEIMSSIGFAWKQQSGHIFLKNFPEGSIKGILQTLNVRSQPNLGGGGLPPRRPFSRDGFISDSNNRRSNFSLIPQKNGKMEVIEVGKNQESNPKNLFFANRLKDKPIWSKAKITRVESSKISDLNSKPELSGTDYEVSLPVAQKTPIQLLIQIFLKKSWTDVEIKMGETAIQKSLKKSAGENFTFEEGIADLKKEIDEQLSPADRTFFYKGLDKMIIIRSKDSKKNVF